MTHLSVAGCGSVRTANDRWVSNFDQFFVGASRYPSTAAHIVFIGSTPSSRRCGCLSAGLSHPPALREGALASQAPTSGLGAFLVGLGQGGECDEKDKRDCSHSSGSSSAVRSAYIASAIPRQRFDLVGRQGASPYRATINTWERCWRPPQTS